MIGALVAGITGSGGASLSSYESIATATDTSSTGTITFSSIPSGFKHLQIRLLNRSSGVGTSFSQLQLVLNNDLSTNYAYHYLKGDGSAVSAAGVASGGSSSGILLYNCMSRAGMTSNIFGTAIIDFLDYASTTKNKTVRTFCGGDANGSGEIAINSGVWLSTNAISSITIYATSGYFVTGSTFALYGIKEA